MKKQSLRSYGFSGFILSFLALFIVGCSRPTPSSWSEQLAAAKQAVEKTGSDFVVRDIHSILDKPGDPTEFMTSVIFVKKNSSIVDKDGKPLYPTRSLSFRDLHLSSTLKMGEYDDSVGVPDPPDWELVEAVDLIKISPADVWKVTLPEAQALNNGQPITKDVYLEIMIGREFPLMKKDAPKKHVPVAWSIKYAGIKNGLFFFVDAQTGEILERYEVGL